VTPHVFLGIDGGGTRTRVFVTDAAGQLTASAEAGLSNPIHASADELRANLQSPIRAALGRIGMTPSACISAFAGMAGVTTEQGRTFLKHVLGESGLSQATLGVDHDIRVALAGGLALRPGVALIVGTGSSCYGRTADGRTWQTGGWEALISDEGSAYFLAREAIAAAVRMADGRDTETPLQNTVFDWLGISHVADILSRLGDRTFTRSRLASFAPTVVSLAEQGDLPALEILDRGASLLAQMVSANHGRLPTGHGPDVVITGGLGTAETLYRTRITTAIHAQLPSAHIHHPELAPAVGAALLAMEQIGEPVRESLLEQLRSMRP
jgi:N-acetylglucosamine kinase-like BadF-type ATPase